MLKSFMKKPTLSALTAQATALAEQFRALAEDKHTEAGTHKLDATELLLKADIASAELLLKADIASAEGERADRIAERIEGFLA